MTLTGRHAILLRTAAMAIALGLAVPAVAAPSIVPAPAVLTETKAVFVVGADTPIIVPPGDAEALRVANYLADLVRRTRGLDLTVRPAPAAPGERAIVLGRDGPAANEAYRLDVADQGVTIAAAQTSGLFYGATTLWQLLTETDAKTNIKSGPVRLAGLHIEDAPRFAWRGLMLDSARHYQSPAFIKTLIDAMTVEKLNVLHWHLTDDQGWRLEIKKYPRLTEVGAWRVPAGAAHDDIDPATGKPRVIGGFYSQDQVRELVAYAAARNITIVPEIEMPGHAQATIVAYPRLGSVDPAPTAVSGDWGVFPYLYNVDDQTFGFLEDVLTEVMALFPSRYIHVGGDEAVKVQWKANPAVQARMKALGIKDENALQSWFVQRMERFLEAHDRRLIGWDEILDGGITENATVMSWRGVDGAVAAAKAGHDAILSPSPALYLNYRQVPPANEALGRGDVVSLQSIYAFDPAPAALTPQQRSHILGVQANMWTEHAPGDALAAQMIFPRAAALAEVGWSPAASHDWSDFGRRLPALLARFRALGVGYDSAAFQPLATAQASAPGQVRVALASPAGLGEIRYTTDGRTPTAASAVYKGPLDLAMPATVRAAAFVGGKPLAASTERRFDAWTLRRRSSHELKLCSQGVPISLRDDAQRDGGHGQDDRATFLVDILNPCWLYEGADLTGPTRVAFSVGQVPYNFQIGDDLKGVNARLRPPRTPDGELEVRQDDCDGPPIAVLPLKPAAGRPGLTRLEGEIVPRGAGAHTLCFTFAQKPVSPDERRPMWLIDWVQLTPPGAPGKTASAAR